MQGLNIVGVVYQLFEVFRWLIIIRIILSWIPISPSSRFISDLKEVIFSITEVYLKPFRSLIPPLGGLDFSVIIGLIALHFIRDFVISLLRSGGF